jgi:outer membrane protein assembly factor BamB
MRHVLRPLLSIAFCAAAITHAAPAAAPAAEPAAMFRGDASGSGLQRGSSAPWIASVRFTFPTGGAIRGSPVAHDGALYVGSSDGLLYALDAKTGATRWQSRIGGAVTSTPAVDDAAVYATSRDGVLHAIDTRTGRERWSHRFGADLGHLDYWDYYLSSPVLADGTLFVGSGDGHVYAFDPARGTLRWRFDAGARVRSTPAVKEGIVVFGTWSGQVRAVRERDGTPLWSFASDGAAKKFADAGNDTTSIAASPTIVSADGGALVAVGGRDGILYALDLRTGRLLWRTTHDGSSWMLSTATDGRTLYVGGGSATLIQALDPATGVERWRFKTRSAVFSSLAIAGETLLASDFAGTLYALERTTGRSLWEFPLGARSLSTPLVAGGIVYAASDLGVLEALDVGKSPSAGDAASAAPRRIVYFEGPRSPKAFGWFQDGLDAFLLAQLKASGYEAMDAVQLAAFMLQQGSTSAPAVVVFADNRFPAGVVDAANGKAAVRRFLDAGGKIALLGPNPLAYKTDPVTGELQDVDFAAPQELFDVAFPPPEEAGGYYAVAPTADGRAMGLRHSSVASASIDAQPHVTPLARDEFGRSSAWLRSYDGKPGTGLLQIELPRVDAPDLAELRAVIEYGITW